MLVVAENETDAAREDGPEGIPGRAARRKLSVFSFRFSVLFD